MQTQQDILLNLRAHGGHTRKLTFEQANEARARYAADYLTQAHLASDYAVSETTMAQLLAGRSYKTEQEQPPSRTAWPYPAGQLTEAGRRTAPSCLLGEGWPQPLDKVRSADPIKLYPVSMKEGTST